MEKYDFENLPVLEDFALFLTFIHHRKEIPATLQLGHLKQKDLFQLNQEMQFKTEWVTAKSMQPAYPELEFFYEVALASGILQLKSHDNVPVLAVEEDLWARYQALPAKDQYFFLLETTWRYLNWEEISGSPAVYFQMILHGFIKFLGDQQPKKAIDVKQQKDIKGGDFGYFSFDLYHKVVQIFSFLGFCDLKPDGSIKKKPDKFTAPFRYLTVTPMGNWLAAILTLNFPFEDWNILTRKKLVAEELNHTSIYSQEKEQLKLTAELEQLNKPVSGNEYFLSELGRLLELAPSPESFYTGKREFQPGNYQFEVSLSQEISRTLELSSQHTLEDLHLAIQEAYKFANDHLYAFYLNTGIWKEENYYTPESFMGPATDSVKIGDLDLSAGQRFIYHFDFGDDWQFVIDVLAINEKAQEIPKPKLIGKVGRTPKQYGNYR